MDFPLRKKTTSEIIGLLTKIADVYGCNLDEIRRLVLKYPQFAGLDHERVMMQALRFGSLVKLTREEVIEKILRNPVLAGYSETRYFAALDVARTLSREGFTPDRDMLDIFFRRISKSPYVPNENRRRISQCPEAAQEPALLVAMRKSLIRQKLRRTKIPLIR